MDPINENTYRSYNDHLLRYLQSQYPSTSALPYAQNYPHDHAIPLSRSPVRCNCPSPVYPGQIHALHIHANSYDTPYNYFSHNHTPFHTARPHGSTTSLHPDSTSFDSRTQIYEADCRSFVGYCSR